MRETDAGCGPSTRGSWGGLVICNEWEGGSQHGERFRQGELAASAPSRDCYIYITIIFGEVFVIDLGLGVVL